MSHMQAGVIMICLIVIAAVMLISFLAGRPWTRSG
jgi:hypothetical protein